MLSSSIAVHFLLGVTGFVVAQTPSGIFPQVNNNLAVVFNGQFVSPGSVVPSQSATAIPQIGIQMGQVNDNANQQYLMMVLDIDSADGSNTKRRRADPPPPAPAASNAPDAPQQPDDIAHLDGKDTFLHCMIQNYVISSNNNNINGAGATLLQSSTSGPIGWQRPNPTDGQHRYMVLLFQQPSGFSVPASVQQMTSGRTNFDLRDFMQEANLPLPLWGNYFVVGSGGSAAASLSTYTTTTTLPNGGPTQTLLGVSTVTGFNGGAATSSVVTLTKTTTLPNGGPTETFLSASTRFGSGSTSLITYTTTQTLPNGGPTQTFIGVSTSFGGQFENGNSAFTSTFTTTTTFANGGPTSTFLTTSTFSGISQSTRPSSGILYSTGFTGLTTVTSTGKTTFSTTTTFDDGSVSSGMTTASTTVTRTVSGVSRVTTSVFSTTSASTTTGFINGQFTTSTTTSSGLVTMTVPVSTGGAVAQAAVADLGLEKFVLGVAGLLLALL